MADNFKVPKLPGFLHRTKESSIKDFEETTSSNLTNESDESNGEKPKEEEETAQTIHDADKSRDEPVALELSYNEPVWSGRPPSSSFFLSVIKNGVQVDSVSLNTPFILFGRLPQCGVHLEHPSISRHHAILQYRPTPSSTPIESSSLSADPTGEAGFYLYDLGSTHGSYLNKNKIQSRKYYRVRVGQVMKFGGSTRIFVLDQPMESVQEVIEAEAEAEREDIIQKQNEYQELLAVAEAEKREREQFKESLGATWGLLTVDDFGSERGRDQEVEMDSGREAYYIDDPKKALKKFFDREGIDLEYETEETNEPNGKIYTVRVMLPIEDLSGQPIYAEGSQKGNKKEAVVKCALEACRLLDNEDVLRNPMRSYKRKKRDWEENDYYDSDEDNFLDRTGDVDKKRKTRMKRVGKIEDTVETYESLSSKLSAVETELKELHQSLENSKKGISGSGDSLDSFMKSISSQVDKQKQSEMKLRIHQLKKEEVRLRKLVKVAEPYRLPDSIKIGTISTPPSSKIFTKQTECQDNPFNPALNTQEQLEPNDVIQSQPLKQTLLSCDTIDSHDNSRSTDNDNPPSNTTPSLSPSLLPPPPKKKVIGPSLPIRKEPTDKKEEGNQWQEDDNYASWLPPEDQTGDGRTKLNEKFGY
ncbi:PREDICTED: kanadaptin-like [Amphimedon queenslandica]|uniref:FHA domain-containing protein n=2 Tax=Amphimedon queenslandica TaxID=400682 RepID=A0AAN0IL55_AMPQE|nr:PREDICTED: kanadaptin-like [Amphimedon queenslandica]|eukprot:XP_011403013.2 PREDICTED: kanadaptin-like [Amphimedon queenslandica]